MKRVSLFAFLSILSLALGCGPDPGSEPATAPVAVEALSEIDPVAEVIEEIVAEPLAQHMAKRYPASLETVVERGFLRVLTSRNAFDFFVDRGVRGGYQYEMVGAFTRFLSEKHPPQQGAVGISFELIPVDDDQLIPLLRAGAADLIAARLTVTPERAELVEFSRPYRTVDELVVTHDQTPPLDGARGLSGKTVAVRPSSSYHASLVELNRTLAESGLEPVRIQPVDDALATERILSLVAARHFPYTVADSMLAELAVEIHPQLRVVEDVALRRGGELAWATLPEATALMAEMNTFLERYKQGSLLGNMAAQRYFESDRALAERLAAGGDRTLSEHDAIFRDHAKRFDLDWRLVAAMACQESRFDATAKNRWGAVGLMQIKPTTAREPYVDVPQVAGAEHASENVRAGLKYLSWIKDRYTDADSGMRERDRLRMALAAYNAGPKTLLRARRRAKQRGLDPDRWFRHVELAMLELGKTEPVSYVSEINQRYLSYVLLGFE